MALASDEPFDAAPWMDGQGVVGIVDAEGARMGPPAPGWLLVSRVGVFAGLQLSLAGGLAMAGAEAPLREAGRWWLGVVSLGNLGTLLLLSRARRDLGGLRSLWRFSRPTWKGDLAWFLGFTVVAGPVGFLPGVLLARALWSAPDVGNAVLFRAVPPVLLLIVAVAFPVTQALAELPLYFGHLTPALRWKGAPPLLAVLVPALVLGLQHVVMPLELDARYLVWRGLMFLPFSVLVGLVLHRRPTLLPWLMVVHGLMDAQVPVLSWLVSTGRMPLAT